MKANHGTRPSYPLVAYPHIGVAELNDIKVGYGHVGVILQSIFWENPNVKITDIRSTSCTGSARFHAKFYLDLRDFACVRPCVRVEMGLFLQDVVGLVALSCLF